MFAIQVSYANPPVPLHFCRVYRAIEMVVVSALMICFDIVLMLRSAYLAIFLCCLF